MVNNHDAGNAGFPAQLLPLPHVDALELRILELLRDACSLRFDELAARIYAGKQNDAARTQEFRELVGTLQKRGLVVQVASSFPRPVIEYKLDPSVAVLLSSEPSGAVTRIVHH